MDEHVTSDFAYIGNRPYIRGADLLGFFLRTLGTIPGSTAHPTEIRSFRISRELDRNGLWKHLQSSSGECENSKPSAILSYVNGEGQSHSAAFFETGGIILRREKNIPSVVCNLELTGPFSGRSSLVSPVDFIKLVNGLIETNKSLHAQTLSSQNKSTESIRFVYAESIPILSPASLCGSYIELEFIHRGHRFIGDRLYTLNIAKISCDKITKNVILCFSC